MKRIHYLFLNCLCMFLCSCTEGCFEERVYITIYNNSSARIYEMIEFPSLEDGIIKTSYLKYKSCFDEVEPGDKHVYDCREEQLRYGIQVLIIKSSMNHGDRFLILPTINEDLYPLIQ